MSKIAEFYQYAVNTRPYPQINNSIFMSIANTMLKIAGLDPVPHGILDHTAQRLQPENFIRYFADYYLKHNSVS